MPIVGSCSNANRTDDVGVTLVGFTVKVDFFSSAANQKQEITPSLNDLSILEIFHLFLQ